MNLFVGRNAGIRVLAMFVFTVLLTVGQPWSVAVAGTCSGVTSYLGIEYVAECTGGSNYRYVETDISCIGGQVVKGATQKWFQGGASIAPSSAQATVVSAAQFSGGKVFGNSEKTHFVLVTNTFAKYNGVLEGIALKPLASAPTIHVDRLNKVLVIPKDIVDLDKDGDTFTICDDCNDNDPAINPGALEICGDGKDNNCNLAVDCADQVCAVDPVCLVPPPIDISPEENPPSQCPPLEVSSK